MYPDIRTDYDQDNATMLNVSSWWCKLSHQVWRKLAHQCMRNASNYHKMPYLAMLRKMEKWSRIRISNWIKTKIWSLLENHLLPMPTESGRHPSTYSWVILRTESSHTHTHGLCHYILDNNCNNNCPITIIFPTLITPTMCHQKVVSLSHITYLMQLSYPGKQSNY